MSDRFWSKVQVRVPWKCWEWQAGKTGLGYGNYCEVAKKKWVGAHRYVYKTVVNDIPENGVIRHTCNNKACVNPTHLRLGTQADNVQDSLKDGIFPHGEDHWNSTLSEDDVIEIYCRVWDGTPRRVLANEYGVHTNHISDIKHGKVWRHLIRGER